MKISDLKFTDEMRQNAWRGHAVELPNSDAHRCIGDEKHAQDFIDNNGDVEIVWNERYKYWEVPEFAETREAYGIAKQRACETWGCE